eukprot:scaffold83313_cov94-Phaeocystis_antarctica.AAC.2
MPKRKSVISRFPPDPPTGWPHSPRWRACGRALSRFYTPSARRQRDPSSRVMGNRSFCGRYDHTSRGTTRPFAICMGPCRQQDVRRAEQ